VGSEHPKRCVGVLLISTPFFLLSLPLYFSD
jgi:hypothetical protein